MCRHALTEIELVPKPLEKESDSMVQYIENHLVNRGSYFIHGARPGEGRTSMIQDLLNTGDNPQQSRWFRISPYTFTTEDRITQVIHEAGVTRNRAIHELRDSAGNVDEAILMARDSHRYIPSTPPQPRNPMEPTDDMLTAWALQRLFRYGTVINDTYEYGSLADAIHRTNVTRFSGYASSLWMNPDFIDSEVRERSLSV
jgi:hypothetical protein